MGHRTVIGFMWVETTASEIWGIPTVIATSENSRLFALILTRFNPKMAEEPSNSGPLSYSRTGVRRDCPLPSADRESSFEPTGAVRPRTRLP